MHLDFCKQIVSAWLDFSSFFPLFWGPLKHFMKKHLMAFCGDVAGAVTAELEPSPGKSLIVFCVSLVDYRVKKVLLLCMP